MSKWLKQNLTLGVIITLLVGYAGGAAVAAVMRSDIDRLKQQIEKMPEDIAVLKSQTADIKDSVDKIEAYIIK
jgi:cell division protein FtsB